MSKSERNKGARGERELCRILNDELGTSVKRNLSQTREGGCDIVLGRFNLEVKRRKGISVHQWMEQAINSCDDAKQTPVVICRGDGKPWLAVMLLEDWIRVARDAL